MLADLKKKSRNYDRKTIVAIRKNTHLPPCTNAISVLFLLALSWPRQVASVFSSFSSRFPLHPGFQAGAVCTGQRGNKTDRF